MELNRIFKQPVSRPIEGVIKPTTSRACTWS